MMLGIRPGTLRAWERRYHIIEPIRNDAGHRLYSEEHVAVIRWLMKKINSGFTIGQAVQLYEQKKEKTETVAEENEPNYVQQMATELQLALLSFDEERAQHILNEAFSLFCINKVAIDLIGTAAVFIYKKRQNGEILKAQKQFALSFLRTKIGNLYYGFKVSGILPKVVTACGPNELCDIGLLIFSLYLRRSGYDVLYVGTGLSSEDIKEIIRLKKANIFFTSCTSEKNIKETALFVSEIEKAFPSLMIGAGGYMFNDFITAHSNLLLEYDVGKTKEEWARWLNNNI